MIHRAQETNPTLRVPTLPECEFQQYRRNPETLKKNRKRAVGFDRIKGAGRV
jgi:hypothetical protein